MFEKIRARLALAMLRVEGVLRDWAHVGASVTLGEVSVAVGFDAVLAVRTKPDVFVHNSPSTFSCRANLLGFYVEVEFNKGVE